jgi:hypothetical protein
MFTPKITVINKNEEYTEIVRAIIKKKKLIPAFRVLNFGKESFKEASKAFFSHNNLPVDEIVVTSIDPTKIIYQPIEIPSVKNMKTLLSIANFKAAMQFSLPPKEVQIDSINGFTSIKKGSIIPTFVVAKRATLSEFEREIMSAGFPAIDILSIKPHSVLNLINKDLTAKNYILFVVDYNYAMIFIVENNEIIGINIFDEGFGDLKNIYQWKYNEDPSLFERELLIGKSELSEKRIDEISTLLSEQLGYQMKMNIQNSLSNSPNIKKSDWDKYIDFYVIGQSELSTEIYYEALNKCLIEDYKVSIVPMINQNKGLISYSSYGLLLRGGESFEKNKFSLE